MRDLILLGAILIFMAMALSNVFVGYLLWGWAGLIGLNAYAFGFMADIGYVQIFAIATLISLIIFTKNNEIYKFQLNRTVVLLALFVLHGLISASLAYPGLERNWEIFTTLSKTALFCALMPMLVFNRKRIHALVVTIVLGISFHGILDGLKFIVSAGTHHSSPIAKFGDNNFLGMILLMCVPFLFYLLKYSERKLARYAFLAVLILTLLAVMASQSRGALIGLMSLGTVYILRKKNKFTAILVVAASAAFITQIAPDQWTSRMETIQTAGEDASFLGRVKAWRVSSAIALENPVFGGGFRAVQSADVWNRFKDSPGLLGFVDIPSFDRIGVSAHSIWFEVLGDQGFVGLLFFVFLFFNAFYTRLEIKRLVKIQGNDQLWAADLADTIAAVLIVYCVSGSLLSAAYFELFYVCIMLLEILKLQQKSSKKIFFEHGV